VVRVDNRVSVASGSDVFVEVGTFFGRRISVTISACVARRLDAISVGAGVGVLGLRTATGIP
jgi:hypothetical protein